MTVSFGYTIFYVADVPATVAFYGAAFGLSSRFVTPEGDYGELETGGITLSFVAHELAESNLAAAGGFTPLPTTGAPVGASITLLADDVAAVAEQAIAAGARPYVGVTEKPWGQTVAYVIDPNGILIEVATPMG